MEAETGSGKTETALWRFKRLFERGEVDGLYFVLPTRVAATAMFARVKTFRDRVFGGSPPAVVLAVPGQVAADGTEGEVFSPSSFSHDKGGHHSRIVARGSGAAEAPGMNVVVPIPDDFAARFGTGADLGRRALEALVLEEYRAGRLSTAELRQVLGFGTRGELDGFLKTRGIYEDYTLDDLERERCTLDRLGL